MLRLFAAAQSSNSSAAFQFLRNKRDQNFGLLRFLVDRFDRLGNDLSALLVSARDSYLVLHGVVGSLLEEFRAPQDNGVDLVDAFVHSSPRYFSKCFNKFCFVVAL